MCLSMPLILPLFLSVFEVLCPASLCVPVPAFPAVNGTDDFCVWVGGGDHHPQLNVCCFIRGTDKDNLGYFRHGHPLVGSPSWKR